MRVREAAAAAAAAARGAGAVEVVVVRPAVRTRGRVAAAAAVPVTAIRPRHVVVGDLGRGGVDAAVVQFRLLSDVDACLLALLEEVVSALV